MKIPHFPWPTREQDKPRFTILVERPGQPGPEHARQVAEFKHARQVSDFLSTAQDTCWVAWWDDDGTFDLLPRAQWMELSWA